MKKQNRRINPQKELPRYYLQKRALTEQVKKMQTALEKDAVIMNFYNSRIEQLRKEISKKTDGKLWLAKFDKNKL